MSTSLAWSSGPAHAGMVEDVETIFPTPPGLTGAIEFWRGVFQRHGSNRVIIHDRNNLSLVWEVLELPVDERGGIDASAATQVVKARVSGLEQRLARLERDATPTDEEDAVLLALAGGPGSPHLVGASLRLRSQRGIADHVRLGIERAQKWLPQIRAILREEGVPEILAALPFVESTYNPLARSHAGAAGLWQLMPATARGLGLRVDRTTDERMDVLKATRAAAKMLRQNYRMLGTWPLAITGYNHGPNGVRRAVEKVGSTDLMTLIAAYDQETWGFASKNFYAEFLLALEILATISAPTPEPTLATADEPAPTREVLTPAGFPVTAPAGQAPAATATAVDNASLRP